MIEGCLYLAAVGDKRAVELYMEQLRAQAAEVQAMRARGGIMIVPNLMYCRNVNEFSRLSGYGQTLPSAHPSDEKNAAAVAKFLEWWDKNKADFKELKNAEPPKEPAPAKPPEAF